MEIEMKNVAMRNQLWIWSKTDLKDFVVLFFCSVCLIFYLFHKSINIFCWLLSYYSTHNWCPECFFWNSSVITWRSLRRHFWSLSKGILAIVAGAIFCITGVLGIMSYKDQRNHTKNGTHMGFSITACCISVVAIFFDSVVMR